MSKAKALSKIQIKHVLSVAGLMTHSESKRCALVLSHAAMRVSEIALLQTKSIISPSGKIKNEIYLPSAICKALKPRTIWITNDISRQIIQQWIDFRIKKQLGINPKSKQYQGLNGESRFIFNNRSRPYSMTEKNRSMADGSIKSYRACDALESIIRTIYKKAGIHQASSHSGRKSLVTNAIINNGRSLEQMARILGHSDPETTLYYVDIDSKRLERMYEESFSY